MPSPNRLPRHLQALAALRADIERGDPQQRLSTEPELARHYRVSRTTLRRAIATLVDEGLLEVRHGAGTFIRGDAGCAARTVALLIAPGMAAHPDDPYYQQFVHHLLLAFTRHGWTLRLAPGCEAMYQRLTAGRSDAVVACVAAFFGRGAEGIGLLEPIRVPLVLVEGEPLPNAPCIMHDNAGGMRAAVARLAELGHREIVHLAGPDWAPTGRERRQGFIDAMANSGLPLRPDFCQEGGYEIAGGFRSMAAWWAAPVHPTAVVCANDLMAIGVLRWLGAHGLRAGRDLSVIGCDDLIASRLAWPALATIALDFAAHAEAVVQAVIHLDRPGVFRTPLTLIERESLGPAPQEV